MNVRAPAQTQWSADMSKFQTNNRSVADPLILRSEVRPPTQLLSALEEWIDGEQCKYYLDQDSIISIGIGQKRKNGEPIERISVIFSVVRKLSRESLAEDRMIPQSINIDGWAVPTDVIEAALSPDYLPVTGEPHPEGLQGMIVRPGVRIQADHGEGTIGALVRMPGDAGLYALCNQHVLMFLQSDAFIVGGFSRIKVGTIHKLAGLDEEKVDAAIVLLNKVEKNSSIIGLNVSPRSTSVDIKKDQIVVKYGASTGITYGKISQWKCRHRYRGPTGNIYVCGFLIETLNEINGGRKISDEGDSGSAWMLANPNGTPTDVMLGLHVSGNNEPGAAGYAFACYAKDVFSKLQIIPWVSEPVREIAPAVRPLRMASPMPAVAARPMVVRTREPALMRGLPADTATILNRLPYGTLVDVLDQREGWALVDLYGTGQADGYLWGDLLRPPIEEV